MSMRHRALAAIALACAGSGPATAQTFQDISAAIARAEWDRAQIAATEADRLAGQGDFYAAYVIARQYGAAGECTMALPIYDALLEVQPYFLPAAERAFVCSMQTGDIDSALQRLDHAISILPPGPQREAVQSMKQGIEARRGVSISGYFDVAPSTNVNRQTAAETIGPLTINEESQGASGVLLQAGITAAVSIYHNSDLSIGIAGRTEFEYDTVKQVLYPSLTAELPVTLGSIGAVSASVVPYVTLGFEDTEYSSVRTGLRTNAIVRVNEVVSINARLDASEIAYRFTPWRDGKHLIGSLGFSWQATPSTLVSVTADVEALATDRHEYGQQLAAVEGRVDHAFEGGLMLGVSAEMGHRWHNRPPPLSIGSNQTDQFYTLGIEASHRGFVIGPLMPTVYYRYTDQDSDNVFYEYDSHDIGLRLRARL